MVSFRLLCAAALALVFSACATAFRDDSRYVRLDDNRGYYILQTGSPLAVQLGYPYPPTSDTGSVGHRGYGNDAIAFRLDKTGVLIAPPAYFSQMPPEDSLIMILSRIKVGVTTEAEIDKLLPYVKSRRPSSDGGTVIYKIIPVYNPLEDDGAN